ncbi:hypothetical protein FNB79_15055 [Formosa sediminum]|uniref:Signal transduction histidine kinase internal region domain-containing protein n=1 Tax=Formosa sediminum TaxID=2594004 RepID=A0A516GUN2_9FLAO|nr:histidine kinase [Formosa sediminum]QDO95234.1 hypothetical protein FNB79_15055 [Formosa sediminum]
MIISKREKYLLIYVSVFIAITLNAHRVLSYFSSNTETVIGVPWRFHLPELLFQIVYQFIFCFYFGYLNFRYSYFISSQKSFNLFKIITLNLIVLIIVVLFGATLQDFFFKNVENRALHIGGYIVRLTLGVALMTALIKVLLLDRKQRVKDLENEKLKTAYFNAKLNNLRDQINPHFLFNSFTNLSSLIREAPDKAQIYVNHLSKVFRSSLAIDNDQIVSLETELELLYSYIELYKLRLEGALDVHIDLVINSNKKLLHMSLQPLLENAIKHNLVNIENPLCIEVIEKEEILIFSNTINAPLFKEASNGIGLLNLSERYKMLIGKDIEIQKTENHFVVKLPLIKNNKSEFSYNRR